MSQTFTSSGQFWHVSASSIFPFPQKAVHSPTSPGQFLQFSHSSIFPFQHLSHFHASFGHVVHVSQKSKTQFPQHDQTSKGQFKQVSHWSICPFPQVEYVRQYWSLYTGHPLYEFQGISIQASWLSSTQSPSKSPSNSLLFSFGLKFSDFSISEIKLSQKSHTQLLFKSDISIPWLNGQLSKEQTQKCFLRISTFILFEEIEQSLFSFVIIHIKFLSQSPSTSSSHISGIQSLSMSHLYFDKFHHIFAE